MNTVLSKELRHLSHHPLYAKLSSIENLRVFMKYHAFAVWDFMSLLKSLQREITCVDVPWFDSKYSPELVRLINEIVLGEESDLDNQGNAHSHFSIYLKAMKEIGADTRPIEHFCENLDLTVLPTPIRRILAFHLDLAQKGQVHAVAASFFYGREKIIPEMFQSILRELKIRKLHCPSLLYYLKRHIEVDSDDHGPKALKCLNQLIDSEIKKKEVLDTALQSLKMRDQLWDFISNEIS